MSDELDITSGGVISIDSADVRDAGLRLHAISDRMDAVVDQLHRACALVAQTDALPAGGIADCAHRLSGKAAGARKTAQGVDGMADAFEYVELTNRQEVLQIQDPADAVLLQPRIDELLAKNPRIAEQAMWLEGGWDRERFENTGDQTWDGILAPHTRPLPGPIGGMMWAAALVPGMIGRGKLEPGARLEGKAPPVEVRPVATTAVPPVTGVQDSIRRIPYGEEGQVAVEKYTFGDGSQKWVAYIDGTRTVLPGTDEPWDMGSNWDMYMSERTSASYAATLEALRQAGVPEGADLSVVAYSQGAAVGSYIAIGDDYEVPTLISLGSPVAPELDADQTLVELRHRGDVVSSLADGGNVGGTGSPESFTARASVLAWTPISQHGFDEYVDTGRQIDASGDPRVEALHRSYYAVLGTAVTVERTEFLAKRPG